MSTYCLTFTLKDYKSNISAYTIKRSVGFVLFLIIYKYKKIILIMIN